MLENNLPISKGPNVKPFYTADEAATRLSVHVKTLRRYIAGGRLKAKRIGKEYRIAAADLDAFAGAPTPSDVVRTRQVLASTIVDIDAIGPDETHRITTMVMAALNSRRGDPDFPRVDTIYYEERGRLRITITAGLGLTYELLRMVNTLLEQRHGDLQVGSGKAND
jgi:excisionase family DNA binding protein